MSKSTRFTNSRPRSIRGSASSVRRSPSQFPSLCSDSRDAASREDVADLADADHRQPGGDDRVAQRRLGRHQRIVAPVVRALEMPGRAHERPRDHPPDAVAVGDGARPLADRVQLVRAGSPLRARRSESPSRPTCRGSGRRSPAAARPSSSMIAVPDAVLLPRGRARPPPRAARRGSAAESRAGTSAAPGRSPGPPSPSAR